MLALQSQNVENVNCSEVKAHLEPKLQWKLLLKRLKVMIGSELPTQSHLLTVGMLITFHSKSMTYLYKLLLELMVVQSEMHNALVMHGAVTALLLVTLLSSLNSLTPNLQLN